MSGERGVVVIGGGQAGFQLVRALRQKGHAGPIRLIAEETHPPYQRPPLSKDLLAGLLEEEALCFVPPAFYADQLIDLIQDRAVEVDRQARRVTLGSGGNVDYEHLVLACGASNRLLPDYGRLKGLHTLRGIRDVRALREGLSEGGEMVIVGAGFLGLEVASTCAKLGVAVTVLEAMPRAMARVVSEPVGHYFRQRLVAQGVSFRFGISRLAVEASGGAVTGVSVDGELMPANLVLGAIGVVPNTDLAVASGLETANGIVVDETLRTSDPSISAIGDSASHPSIFAGGRARLESVQNAVDQANCVAARLTGEPAPYRRLPWFWSEQSGIRLQIAGVAMARDDALAGGPLQEQAGFSVLRLRGDRVVAVESVDRPRDHMLARRLLASGPVLRDDFVDAFSAGMPALA
ncbi:MAG: NAD(P)/FAD-dependent oxidoreductase [Rhizobiaceae bacterium]